MKASKLIKGSQKHARVLKLIRTGLTTDEIRAIIKVPRQAIAAIRAHDTMRTYAKK